MRKLAILVLFVLLSLSATGCGNESAEINNSILTQSYQGTLEELPIGVSGLDVTHVLITESKNRVYIRSLLFDLSTFVDKQVRIFGNYIQEDISGKPVDIITVTSIDLLDDSAELDEIALDDFTSPELGLAIKYDSNAFEVDQSSTRLILTSLEDSGALIVKLNKLSPEVDVPLYIKQNYKGSKFESIKIGSRTALTNKDTATEKLGYIFERDSFFYDFSSIGLKSIDKQELIEMMELYLKNFKFVDINNDFFDVKLEAMPEESQGGTQVSTDSPVSGSNSKFTSVISDFQSKAKNIIADFSSAVSYAFTDNGYFYVVYLDSNSKNLRSLVKYSNSNFEKIAGFERGTNTDWKLISGDNVAYERPQTVVIMASDGSNREVEVEKGYRYFESLPLGFGIQYPQNWYYSRQNDAYFFANGPIESSTDKVLVNLVKSSFDSAPGSIVSSVLKRQSTSTGIAYSVKVNNYYVTVSGPNTFDQQISIMANSIKELKVDN